MKKKILCMLLAGIMILSMAGCDKATMDPGDRDDIGQETGGHAVNLPVRQPADDDGDPTAPAEMSEDPPEKPGDLIIDTDYAPYWFEDDLQAFLEDDKSFGDKSYMVSPASLKAALCLAIEGADGETRDALFKAAGFWGENDMQNWYNALLGKQMDFMERYEALKSESENWGDGSDPGYGFDIANAIWDNLDFPGGFRQEYIEAIVRKYGAAASSSDGASITADVNNWCDEQTHGMIRNIAQDLSKQSSILANALYIKSGWMHEFSEYYTEKGDFTKPSGDIVSVEYMNQTEDFRYYKDYSGREYAMFPLDGDIWLTVCLDDTARVQDLFGGMYKSEYELLDVKMPKLDLETEFGDGELVDFLEHLGAGVALSDGADFSKMTDAPYGWHIGGIAQKTRIKTDEKGLEAAAVTMIAMADNAAILEPVEPIPFHMDKPFSFMITAGRYSRDSDAVILFFGQYAG